MRGKVKMKISGMFLLLFLFIGEIANATVQSGFDSAVNYTMKYPLIYTNNEFVQEKINSDIYQYIYKFKYDYQKGGFIRGKFDYKLKYEDDDYVSVIIWEDRWTGGAHGQLRYVGLNYSKHTGEKIPLSYFVNLSSEDTRKIHSMAVYNERGNIVPEERMFGKPIFDRYHQPLSNNYYMLGNGEIALIYQPYQMASFVNGMTYIKLTANWIDYFNRKNSI